MQSFEIEIKAIARPNNSFVYTLHMLSRGPFDTLNKQTSIRLFIRLRDGPLNGDSATQIENYWRIIIVVTETRPKGEDMTPQKRYSVTLFILPTLECVRRSREPLRATLSTASAAGIIIYYNALNVFRTF